jgi:hypothetical protein
MRSIVQVDSLVSVWRVYFRLAVQLDRFPCLDLGVGLRLYHFSVVTSRSEGLRD